MEPKTTVFECAEPGCGRRFNRKYTLEEHSKIHTGERPHICPVRTCGKRFSTSGNLSRHKRLHGYIEPLPCPVDGCICAFPSANKLEKHMKFHYGTATKVCSVPGCGKTFSTTGNLNRHLKNHHQVEDVEKLSVAVGSPTSAEQWAADSGDDAEPAVSWLGSCFTPIGFSTGLPFEHAWNPELMHALELILDDSSVGVDPVAIV